MAAQETVLHVTEITDPSLAQEIWETYIGSFADTDEHCPQDQICYDKMMMTLALSDTDYQKFVLKVEDRVIGICLLTNNLAKARIAYCNDRYYTRRFPNYVAQGRLYYVTAICVLPKMQSMGFGLKLLEAVIAFIDKHQSMVAYDYSDTKNSSLTGLIQYVGTRMSMNLVEIQLDRQIYTTLHGTHYGDPS